MQSPTDWTNVEMTGFVKYKKGQSEKKDDPDEFTWYARGGDHGQLSFNGDNRFAKEQYFVNYDFTDTKVRATSHLKDKRIGFEFVVYNLPQLRNGSTFVKIENWINENADGITWKKVDENIDNGGWVKKPTLHGFT